MGGKPGLGAPWAWQLAAAHIPWSAAGWALERCPDRSRDAARGPGPTYALRKTEEVPPLHLGCPKPGLTQRDNPWQQNHQRQSWGPPTSVSIAFLRNSLRRKAIFGKNYTKSALEMKNVKCSSRALSQMKTGENNRKMRSCKKWGCYKNLAVQVVVIHLTRFFLPNQRRKLPNSQTLGQLL